VQLYVFCKLSEGASFFLQGIAAIKVKALELLQTKLRLADVHYAAAFLCPNTRKLKLLDEEGKTRARRVILSMLMENEDGKNPKM